MRELLCSMKRCFYLRRVVRVIGKKLRAGKVADMLEPPFRTPETFKSLFIDICGRTFSVCCFIVNI